MDQSALQSYLSAKLGKPVIIRQLIRSFPGLSRETWLVELEPGAPYPGLVVRVEAPGGGICPTVFEDEWRVYQTLFRTNVPVAEPLWYDEAPELTQGRPLFVRVLVDGSTYLPGLHDDTAEAARRRERVAEEHAEKLALVHTLDWKALGFGDFLSAPASVEDAARHELENVRDMWMRTRTYPSGVITEAFYWFEDHLPAPAPRLSLLKGNNGIGEEIWRDDKIVAFSDWELAGIGDPTYDWANSQGMMKLCDRERSLTHYEKAAGFTLSRESLSYYIVWEAMMSGRVLHSGLRAFLTGEDPRLARCTLGAGRAKTHEHLLGAILDMDLEEAAAFVTTRRANPYHQKEVSGG